MSEPRTFHAAGLRRQHASGARAYMEFLRSPTMSAGLYVLPSMGDDPQSPHSEDEVYVVLKGRGQIQIGDEDRPVGEGSIVFVPANTEHRFHSLEEPLEVLVVFAPAEGTARGADASKA